MKILEHNVETGEVIERDATPMELAELEAEANALAAKEAAKEAKESATASAVAKLEAIGLTAEEIAALRG